MKFAIRGAGFVNKGAELMLHAILRQVRKWDNNNIVAVDLKTGNQSQRTKLGLYTIPRAEYKRAPYLGELISASSQLFSKEFLSKFKIIPLTDVEVIFDSSGFAYSDQWGTSFVSDVLKFTKRCRATGKKIIFLPQAFGPFDVEQNRLNMVEVIENSDLIFARDRTSFNHLIELSNNSSKVKVSPDFTNLVEGVIPEYVSQFQNFALIVPNARMIDKNQSLSNRSYISLLQRVGVYLKNYGYEIAILIHENNDIVLAEELLTLLGPDTRLIQENNPLKIKGLIGQASLVLGSRYHALVSSLSQGILTLGTSWSHKYEALFKDYNCPELLISSYDEEIDISLILGNILNEPNKSYLVNKISLASRTQKNRSKKMWEEIYLLLNPSN